MSRRLGTWWVALAVCGVFLYTPIMLVMGMSFNASRSPFNWTGFTFGWYGQLLNDAQLMEALRTSLIIAFVTMVLSTLLGTMLAVGITRYSTSRTLEVAVLTPAILPDLVLAIGLMALFFTLGLPSGMHTIILAHTAFCTAFVVAVVRARLGGTDQALEEASRDLGAGAVTTFVRVTLPSIAPAVIAAAVLSFTLSLDEFVVAFFAAGPSTLTLPIAVYSRVKTGITPEINALATVLIIVTLVAVAAAARTMRSTEEDA